MIAFEGKVKGNTVIVEDDDISAYNGNTVIVTVLDNSFSKVKHAKSSRPPHREIKDKDAGDSFHKLLQLKKGFQFDEDFDAEKEIEEALSEKYGSFD